MVYAALIVWAGSIIAILNTQPYPMSLYIFAGAFLFSAAGHLLPQEAPYRWVFPTFLPHWLWPGCLARIMMMLFLITGYVLVLWGIGWMATAYVVDWFYGI